jgi:zinc protease
MMSSKTFMSRAGKQAAAALSLVFALTSVGLATANDVPSARPEMAQKTLSNGMRVVAVRNALSPVVSTWMNYLVGSDDDGDLPGIAHAAEHMMFRGSRSVSGTQFADTMAVMGGNFNGETGAEITSYYFEVPSQDLEVAMKLEASRSAGLVDEPALWEHERGAISQEVALRNSSASYRLTTKILANVLKGTPYANEGLGTAESFRTLSADQLAAFHRKYYMPNNAVYVVVGDIEPDKVIAQAERIFGSIPPGRAPGHMGVPSFAATPAGATFIDNENALPVSYLVLGYRMPGYDSSEFLATQVLFNVLANDRGPLQLLREGGDVVRTQASLRSFPSASVGYIGASVRLAADGESVAERAKIVLERIRIAGLSASLVDAAKRRLETDAAIGQTSIFGEARTWSQAIAVEHRQPVDNVAAIKRVTTEQVNRLLSQYLQSRDVTTGLALSKPSGRPSRSDVGPTERAAAIPSTVHGDLPEFAKSLLANTRAPAHWSTPIESTLPNGLRLIVVKNTASDAVILRGMVHSKSTVDEPAGYEGVARILDIVFQASPGGSDHAEYSRRSDELGAEFFTGTGFGFDLQASKFERGLDLLSRAEIHPALDEASVESAKARTLDEVRNANASSDFLSEQALCNGLYGARDRRCRVASMDSVKHIETHDVSDYYKKTFRPDRTTIVVVGNIEPIRARQLIERSFGGWSSDSALTTTPNTAAVPNAASQVTIASQGRVQSSVTLAQVLPIVRRDDDFVALRVSNALLTGGVFGSLLYEDLREQTGLVYSVSSQIQTSDMDSVFKIAFGSDPSNVDVAMDIIRRQIHSLQSGQIDEHRLARAKALLINDLPLSMESYNSIASRILFYVKDGLPADNAYREANRVFQITPDQIRLATSKYLRPDSFAVVVEGPMQSAASAASGGR